MRGDVLKSVFGSRIALGVVFSAFLVIGVICVRNENSTSVSIGTSLIASALVSLATLMIDQIRNSEQMRAADLAKAGLVAAYQRRDLPEYDAKVREDAEIDIAGYTLRSFSETNEEVLRQRVVAGKPVRVRALLVDPESEAARFLERSESLTEGTYAANLLRFRKRMANIEGFEVRTIKRHLPMMIYRIDDVLYTGPFPTDGRSRMAATLKLGLNGWLFERQKDDFEKLWQDASALPAGCKAD